MVVVVGEEEERKGWVVSLLKRYFGPSLKNVSE
jgi:hypothetical protein